MDNSSDVVDITASYSAEECLRIALVQSESGEILSGLWYVGVILSIVSSVAANLGVNIQKLSMMKEIEKTKSNPSYREKPYILQKIWWIGLLMVIVGSIGDFGALGFAAQSLATPVGGFTMVVNLFFSKFFLNETLGKRDLIATVLVVLGVIAVAASADKSEKTYTLSCLLKLYQRYAFIGYICGIVTTCGLLFFLTQKLGKLRETEPNGAKYQKWKKFHPICPSALSGLIGAQTVLFAKCCAELIKKTAAGENQFGRWETYLIILCMFFAIFNQLHWLSVGLKYFDAVLIIPVFQCFFIMGGVIGGGVFFDEFSNLKTWEQGLFAVGVSITIFGVFLLAQREHAEISDAKVVPDHTSKDGDVAIISEDANNKSLGGGNDPLDASLRSNPDENQSSGSFQFNGSDRPPTPMPLSLQYHSLAMSDLYHALRDTLSTPDKAASRTVKPSVGSYRSNAQTSKGAPSLPNLDESKEVIVAEDFNKDECEDSIKNGNHKMKNHANNNSSENIKQAW